MLTALDFFAGSGLVRLGMSPEFETVWANDICGKKQAVYRANFPGDLFYLGDVRDVRGVDLPSADLAWASFPCQDLSLAGNLSGMDAGTRSGLFWEWIRILRELRQRDKLPPVLVAENVVGLLVAEGSRHFQEAYEALRSLGYRAGALVLDAKNFVPQSRPRAFLVAVRPDVDLEGLCQQYPSGQFHSPAVKKAAFAVNDRTWIWWSLPVPTVRVPAFSDVCERMSECSEAADTNALIKMLSPVNQRKLLAAIRSNVFFAGTAYRRTRPGDEGTGVQRLEIRFDGIAGCLRTPNGGSSRQTVVLVEGGMVRSRLMTVRECARLMGAPDTFQLAGSYNDGYRAMGDAVAVPVTRWLTQHLLEPLAIRSRKMNRTEPCSVSGGPIPKVDEPVLELNACD